MYVPPSHGDNPVGTRISSPRLIPKSKLPASKKTAESNMVSIASATANFI